MISSIPKVLSARVEERDEQIARLERILKEKGATLAASEKAVAEAKVEMKRLQDALGIAERDTTSLRGEINQMALTLAQLREELKTSEKNLTKTTADLNKTIATLTADRDRLQKLLDETKKSMSSMGDKASNEVLALRKLMEEKEAEFVRIKGDMERAQRQSLEDEQVCPLPHTYVPPFPFAFSSLSLPSSHYHYHFITLLLSFHHIIVVISPHYRCYYITLSLLLHHLIVVTSSPYHCYSRKNMLPKSRL